MLNTPKNKEIMKKVLLFILIQNLIYLSYFMHYCIVIEVKEPMILQYLLYLNSSSSE